MYADVERQDIFIANSPDGIVGFDSGLTITIWNASMEKLLQTKTHSVLGKNIQTLSFVQQLILKDIDFVNEVLKGRSSSIGPVHLFDRLTLEISYFPIFDGQGKVAGGMASFRKMVFTNSLIHLSASTYSLFHHILESINDAFVALDSNWCYTYVNKKAAQIFNRDQHYLIGKHIWTEFPEGVGQPFYKAYYQAIKEKRTITLEEYYSPFDRWFENRIFPLADGLAIFFSDITERVKEKEKLQKLNGELEKKNKALLTKEKELQERNFELDQIIYKTSHDLRSPLTSIMGLITLIKQEENIEEVKHYLQYIDNRVHKLDEFIKSMLNFSKISRIKTKPLEVDLHLLVSNALNNSKYLANYDRVDKQVFIEGEKLVSDELKLEIIFNNLISNAIKYMNSYESLPFIRITIRVSINDANIEITDNGIGIKDKFQGQIFDMFFRATDVAEGSGLGLYIVKQTVDKLNGTIQLISSEGKGTTFLICIPNLLAEKMPSAEN